jgi:nucleoid-associated protein YgaU
MPNDAKLGLVVGVGLVIAVGVIFYRKDAPTGSPASIDKPIPVQPVAAPSNKDGTVAKTTGARRHTMAEGETLAGIARQYLGDEAKVDAIRELNPTLQGSGDPPPGTVLVLPVGDRGDQ